MTTPQDGTLGGLTTETEGAGPAADAAVGAAAEALVDAPPQGMREFFPRPSTIEPPISTAVSR